MKQKYLFALLLGAVATSAQADWVVLEKDGSATTAATGQVKRITFRDGMMITLLHDGTQTENAIADVRKCYFGDAPDAPVETAIEALGTDDNTACRFHTDGHTLTVSGAAGHTLLVRSVDGRTLKTLRPDASNAVVNLSDLPAGTYVVTVGTQTLKLLKR